MSRKRRPKAEVTSPPVEPIDVSDFAPDESAESERPKRAYKKRKAVAPEMSLGVFMRGMGAMVAQATGVVFGRETPMSEDEGQMLQHVGDCAQQFGNSEELNENLGKYSFYLLAGGFGVIILSRLIPALKERRRALVPTAQVVSE